MAVVTLPQQRWTRQPQYPAPIDWSHPLTLGLVFAFGGQLREAVNGSLPTANVGAVIPTDVGLAYSATSTTHLRTYPLPTIAGTTPLTVMSAPRCNESNTTRKRAIRLITTDNGSGFWFEHSNGVTNVHFAGYQTSGGGFPATRSDLAPGTIRRNVAASHSGGSQHARLWIDGVEYAATENSPGARKAINQITLGNNTSGSGFHFRGDLPWVYVFLREVPPEEQAEIFRNPWQIFQAPTRRTYSFAGGAATYDIAGATVGEGETTGAISHTPAGSTYSIAADTVGEGETTGAISHTAVSTYTIAGSTVGEGLTTGAISHVVQATYTIAAATIGEGATTGAISVAAAYAIAGDTIGIGATAGAVEHIVPGIHNLAASTAGIGLTTGAISHTPQFTYSIAAATVGEGITTGAISTLGIHTIAGATVGIGETFGNVELVALWTRLTRGRFKSRRTPRYPSRW